MDYESIFQGRELVEIQFCALSVSSGELVVTEVLDKSTVKVTELPPPDVARARLGPGEAVLVEDVLYAWVPPEAVSARSGTADAPKPACDARTSNETAEPAEPAEPERAPNTFEGTLDPVTATERLARASFEILRRNEELLERHMRRVADLDERQKKLDQRAEQLARAQVEHLTVLREVTADVVAGVKQVSQAPEPAALPEDFTRARDNLAGAGAPSVPFAIVAAHIGAFLRGAGAEFFFPDVTASPAE